MGCAFSETAMKGMEGYVVGLVEDFIGRVGEVVDCGVGGEEKEEEGKEKWSKCLNMSQWCNWLVFDIMGELVFGKSFGTLGSHIPNRKAIFLLGRAARRNYVVAAMPALISTGLEKFLPVLRGLYRDRCQYLAFGKQQVVKVMERQEQQEQQKRGGDDDDDNKTSLTKRKDIFSLLLTAQDPDTGDNIPLPELWMESNTLIVAGSDTTSTTLAATLYYLLHNPPTLHRLRAEILATFSTRHEIRMGPKMQSCSYLRAVIDETMRMTPAVGGNLPREVLPGGLEIPELGVFLPEGVDVGVPIYAVQHHGDYVVRPFVFDPERWLHSSSSSSSGTGGEKEEQRHHPQNRSSLQEVFTPFSIGHRSCLGKPLVYMELSLALARLIFAFDMRLSSSPSSSSTSSASASSGEYSEKHAQKEEKLSERIQKEIKSGKRQPFEYQLLDWFMSRNEGPWVEFRWREKERR